MRGQARPTRDRRVEEEAVDFLLTPEKTPEISDHLPLGRQNGVVRRLTSEHAFGDRLRRLGHGPRKDPVEHLPR